jgi:ADP-ribose pyrophosphatase YjhB (NUDIX family)
MENRKPYLNWTVEKALLRLSNPWLALVGERLKTPDGQELDYWRIEKTNSAVVVPIWQQQLVLAPLTYRPGIQEVTLDFPGGRVTTNQSPQEAALIILQRELGIEQGGIQELVQLNQVGWPVNSSLSNQLLYGFRAKLHDDTDFAAKSDCRRFPLTQDGISQLLKILPCLQCRAVLLELLQQLEL